MGVAESGELGEFVEKEVVEEGRVVRVGREVG